MSKKFSKFLVGAGIGASLTALFTTKKGKDVQKKISEICDDIIDKVKNLDKDEVKESVSTKIEEIKQGIADLDKEKVKKEASKKAKELQTKANELVEYAKEKGIPAVRDAAINLCEETKKATDKIMKKLEDSKKD